MSVRSFEKKIGKSENVMSLSEESLFQFLFLFGNSTLGGGELTFHSEFPIYMHELILREQREG